MLKDRDAVGSPGVPDECAGCGGRIQDRYYLLAVDRQWHGSCLRCCECRLPLDSELTCFSRDGNIYCKEDYYRMFCVKRCARCGAGITANELVMRARDAVYHLTCFSCAACGSLLSKGDVFGMRDNLVYCRPHYEQDYDDDSVYRCQEMDSEGSPSQFYGGPSQKGRPRKRKLAQSPDDMQVQTMRMASTALEILHRGELSSSMESLAYDSGAASPGSVSSARTKRMRTSFKHHQLRTMKSYFAVNQNPDAKDLKQLAQKTGLSKRVLQVWFQNARAKWRRNIMRQETNPTPHSIQPPTLMLELQTLDENHHPVPFTDMY
ncbi:LIM/homeobox protein Lhx9-like [Cydia splendana]|uniref:LIM/homeobox protein Lhx9-like n=1 Tax=Cydia splendana TaxID=1100963 RepID=UPI00213E33E3